MRFARVHEVTSYLMVAAAFATLALSHELSPLTLICTFVAGAASYFFAPSRQPIVRTRAWKAGWNVVTVAALAWTVIEAIRGDLLPAGIRFLCVLLVNKLWNRRRSRDYLQAYAVSFLMLVAGAALNNDLAYAGCFLAYVVFATWTLTLFHLRREMEENYLIKHSDDGAERVEVERILSSRRIVGWSFLGATALVSLGIFLSATVVFLLFPRLGFGFFASHGRRGQMTVGFSQTVELDRYGLVKDNPQVVMRVEFAEGAPPEAPLYFRGITFDHYEHGRWSRTLFTQAPIRRWAELRFVGAAAEGAMSDRRAARLTERALVQHVYLDPLDTSVLFAASTPVAFAIPGPLTGGPSPLDVVGKAGDEFDAVEWSQGRGQPLMVERKSGLRYTVYSDIAPPDARALAAASDTARRDELEPYLTVPADLPPRIAALALTLTADKHGPWQKAQALTEYLARYRYTLDLPHSESAEPLEDFLFKTRAGHCEYFASALAVMLRTLGVPARSVNGFYGGEWNAFGRYLAIRQGDAHAWVELWVDGVGWVTVDPTPPGRAPKPAALHALAQMLDHLELVWFKYVIEYDLGKQVEIARAVGHIADLPSLRSSFLHKRRALAELGGGAALVVSLLAFFRARRRRHAPAARLRHGRAAHEAYQRALAALAQRGFSRATGETGRELSARLVAASDEAARPFGELVELYYAARFGATDVPNAELDRLAAEVAKGPRPNI